jgi:RNA polymerase-binding transcription factor DksA
MALMEYVMCGLDIDKDRLIAMPFAKRCLACQKNMERELQ